MNITDVTPQTSAPGTRKTLSASIITGLIIVRNGALPLAISLLCMVIATAGLPPRRQAPHNALIVMGIITIGAALVERRFRRQLKDMGADETALPNTLPDLTGALYLAILVLVGTRAAIPFAIATPIIVCAPLLLRDRRAIIGALRQGMSSSIILLLSGIAYAWVAALVPHVPTTLRAHVTAALAASIVFLVGASVARFLLQAPACPEDIGRTIRAYVTGPALLFQILLLSCIPLLPLTEALQPVEIEFAWLLLLAPMGAVYFLALTSVRLRQQSEKLQRTISELNATRLRETQLQSYAALITRAQEDERRRLARDLHDDTAQALIALSRGLDALSYRHINPISSPEDVHFLNQLIELTQRTLDSVRRACQDLRPSVLDDLGLSAALESLAGAMTERGLPCAFEERGVSQPYPLEVEVAVYRIAQEALSNAQRHAHSRQAKIELRYRSDSLRLVVSDNGSGFDVSKTLAAPGGASHSTAQENGSGLGLMGMRERAMLIGATLDIQSAPGAGTTITLEAPATAPLTQIPVPVA